MKIVATFRLNLTDEINNEVSLEIVILNFLFIGGDSPMAYFIVTPVETDYNVNAEDYDNANVDCCSFVVCDFAHPELGTKAHQEAYLNHEHIY